MGRIRGLGSVAALTLSLALCACGGAAQTQAAPNASQTEQAGETAWLEGAYQTDDVDFPILGIEFYRNDDDGEGVYEAVAHGGYYCYGTTSRDAETSYRLLGCDEVSKMDARTGDVRHGKLVDNPTSESKDLLWTAEEVHVTENPDGTVTLAMQGATATFKATSASLYDLMDADTDSNKDGTGYPILNDENYDSLFPRYFSDERAWVMYEANGVHRLGAIDEEGQLVYGFDMEGMAELYGGSPDIEGYFAGVTLSPFVDGLAYVVRQPAKYAGSKSVQSSSVWDGTGAWVIDKDGHELFRLKNDEHTTYVILGYASGAFLVGRYSEGYAEQAACAYLVDKQGAVLGEELALDSGKKVLDYAGKAVALGEGIIHCPAIDACANVSTGVVFEEWPNAWYDNVSFWDGETSVHGQVYNIDDFASKAAFDAADAEGRPDVPRGFFFGNKNLEDTWSEGVSFVGSIPAYVGLHDDTTVSIELPEAVECEFGSAFHDGFASLILKGADGEHYVTCIDRSGAQQYEPLQVSGYEYGFGKIRYWGGYAFVEVAGRSVVVTPKGRQIPYDTGDLSELGDVHVNENVSGGFMLKPSEGGTWCTYESLDRKTVIDKVIVAQ